MGLLFTHFPIPSLRPSILSKSLASLSFWMFYSITLSVTPIFFAISGMVVSLDIYAISKIVKAFLLSLVGDFDCNFSFTSFQLCPELFPNFFFLAAQP
jgi:hypothetical protein